MNCYEKKELIIDHIQDIEKQLGQYLCVDECEKTDKYAQYLIAKIKDAENELYALYEQPENKSEIGITE